MAANSRSWRVAPVGLLDWADNISRTGTIPRSQLSFGVSCHSTVALGFLPFWRARGRFNRIYYVGNRFVGHSAQPWSIRRIRPKRGPAFAPNIYGHHHHDWAGAGLHSCWASSCGASAKSSVRPKPGPRGCRYVEGGHTPHLSSVV